jgi:hypothetical protein
VRILTVVDQYTRLSPLVERKRPTPYRVAAQPR